MTKPELKVQDLFYIINVPICLAVKNKIFFRSNLIGSVKEFFILSVPQKWKNFEFYLVMLYKIKA